MSNLASNSAMIGVDDPNDEPTMSAATNVTTREFFESYIPAAVELHDEMAATILRGSTCFIVHGEGGWTLRCARGQVEVSEEIDLDADLVIAFGPESFAAFKAGRGLDPDAEDPVCMGEPALLVSLGRVLSPPQQGALSAQLAFREVP